MDDNGNLYVAQASGSSPLYFLYTAATFPAAHAPALLSTATGAATACVAAGSLSVFSPSGLWEIAFRSSGDLALVQCAVPHVDCQSSGVVSWSTGGTNPTAGAMGRWLCMRQDGNLVIFASGSSTAGSGAVVWAANSQLADYFTFGTVGAPYALSVDDVGNVFVARTVGTGPLYFVSVIGATTALASTAAGATSACLPAGGLSAFSPSGSWEVAFTAGGNLAVFPCATPGVDCQATATAAFATGTSGAAARLCLQASGEVAIYAGGSSTAGSGATLWAASSQVTFYTPDAAGGPYVLNIDNQGNLFVAATSAAGSALYYLTTPPMTVPCSVSFGDSAALCNALLALYTAAGGPVWADNGGWWVTSVGMAGEYCDSWFDLPPQRLLVAAAERERAHGQHPSRAGRPERRAEPGGSVAQRTDRQHPRGDRAAEPDGLSGPLVQRADGLHPRCAAVARSVQRHVQPVPERQRADGRHPGLVAGLRRLPRRAAPRQQRAERHHPRLVRR